MSSDPKDRRQHPRHEATLGARLLFSVLMLDTQASSDGVQRMMVFAGHTRDLSETGLAVVVRARNIPENYLNGGEGAMRIELDLPDGAPLEIHATPVRYEQINEGETERGYLIGARITNINEHDRERFRQYLRTLT